MNLLISIFTWVKLNITDITAGIAYLIAFASIIVKLTPTIKDDNVLKAIVKFLGKYIALDKYGPDGNE